MVCQGTASTEHIDTVVAHSCVYIETKFTDEQYTTMNQSTAGHFDLRVFVNYLQGHLIYIDAYIPR